MRRNLITLIFSLAIFMATLLQASTLLDEASVHGRYYATALLTISGLVALIALIRLLRQRGRHSAKSADSAVVDRTTLPRQHYRMQFQASPRPRFVHKNNPHDPTAAFACDVCDVSETGVSLDCAGIYAIGQVVCGEIIFPSGRTAPINGVVVRVQGQRTSLALHCTVDPLLLMAEQREQIAAEKFNEEPRPAVTHALADTSIGELPSHSPKGICRLKRS